MLLAIRRLFLMLAVGVFAVGCDGFDSGVPPNEVTEEEGATVEFATGEISITEEGSPVSIDVTLTNPPGNEVTAEVLYANGISETDPSDFNLPEGAALEGGNGYVAGSVTFPADAEDGATRSIELDIQDEEENEPRESGVFALQNVQGNASVGDRDRLTVSIGAIEIFAEDFEDEELAPMTVVNVTSGNGWETGSFEGNNYAVANAFNGSEASNSWLLTPALNFNDFEDETLTFRNAKNFDDGETEQPLQVKVSTEYDGSGNPEDVAWTDVTDRVENLSEGDFNYVSSGEVDLSDDEFQADEVYVAFRYQSSGTGPGTSEEQQIDDVRIVGR